LLGWNMPAMAYEDPVMGSLQFVANRGQWPAQVQYRTQLPDGGVLWLQPNGYRLALRHPHDSQWLADHHLPQEGKGPQSRAAHFQPGERPIRYEAIEVAFLGGNTQNSVQEKMYPFHHNYFLGDDESRWASDVPLSQAVRLKEVYPGTDLLFYSDDVLPKYDWVLAPGADPHQIRMEFSGARALEVVQGQLVIQTHYQEWVEEAPRAYQEVGGRQHEVPCNFVLDGTVVSFEFPYGYDPTLPLIIDPVLVFSTYSGSSADNWGFTACYDDEGNLYSGGIVFNSGFPTTVGAFQETWSGAVDIGIQAYDSVGSSLIYATYLGGLGPEVPQSLLVAPDHSLVMLGIAGGSGFPTVPVLGVGRSSFQGGDSTRTSAGFFPEGSDLIVTRLSPNGNELLGSTYLGGTKNEGVRPDTSRLHFFYGDDFRGDIIADQTGNLYFASLTQSADFPVTGGAFQQTLGGNSDALVVSLNPDFSLRFATYLGGAGADAATSVKVTANGNVLIGGGTNSAAFPGILGGAQPNLAGGVEGYVSLFSPTGQLLAGTFLGTPEDDQVYFVDIDTAGQVFALGSTYGDYPVVGSVLSVANSGQFLHQLSPMLDSTGWSTAIGSGVGDPDFSPTAFLVNECGNIYMSGWFGFSNPGFSIENSRLPLSGDAYRNTTDFNDFYLAVLQRDASGLLYGSYFGEVATGGGSGRDHVDGGTSRFDKRGIVYQSVCASCSGSSGFPTTPGVWSRFNGSTRCNNAAFKFDFSAIRADLASVPAANSSTGMITGCAPFRVDFQNLSDGGVEYIWDFGDGTQVVQTRKQNTPHIFDEGTYRVVLTVIDENTCLVRDSAIAMVHVGAGDFEIGEDQAICLGAQAQLFASGGNSYLWTPTGSVSNPTSPMPTVSPSETTTYFLTATNEVGCVFTDNVTVE
ncbi:MAG: PKD domain-containing protein, partial [Bacteroidota bacterium]